MHRHLADAAAVARALGRVVGAVTPSPPPRRVRVAVVDPVPVPVSAPLPAPLSAPSNDIAPLNASDQDDHDATATVRSQTDIPASRARRMWHYGGLAVGVAAGAVAAAVRGDGGALGSVANAERLVRTLGRMRGAALKLGQMLSIQDDDGRVPAEVRAVLQRLRHTADAMPTAQRERVLRQQLGDDWRSAFASFGDEAVAAASIGQVHRAQLQPRLGGTHVAVKVQFPGVAAAVQADLDSLKTLLLLSRLLPKGLFLDRTIDAAKTELAWETDYRREAAFTATFRRLVADEPAVRVPAVVEALSTAQVLTTEWMPGVPVERVRALDQATRNHVATLVLRLCLRETFEWRLMQTDPNWANFLYDARTRQLNLIDFGATREFDKPFTDMYLRVVHAATQGDRDGVRHWSKALGYLTGDEPEVMIRAHIDSVLALAEPFAHNRTTPTDFQAQDIPKRVSAAIPLMLQYRLVPPPQQTYSLHRKLSGAFLLCAKLGAVVDGRSMFDQIYAAYTFD